MPTLYLPMHASKPSKEQLLVKITAGGGQFYYDELEPTLIMDNAFNALINEVGIDLDESDFKLLPEMG